MPWNTIWPPTIRPVGSGTRRMMDSAAIVLPDPLSPTTPSVSPWRMRKLTPSTALTTPSRVKKWVLRSTTSSRGVSSRSGVARAIDQSPMRGSRESRNPSPIRVKPSIVSATRIAGNRTM